MLSQNFSIIKVVVRELVRSKGGLKLSFCKIWLK
jgi:hypothetical protein